MAAWKYFLVIRSHCFMISWGILVNSNRRMEFKNGFKNWEIFYGNTVFVIEKSRHEKWQWLEL